MPQHLRFPALALAFGLLGWSTATAQSLTDRVSQLLTEQRPDSGIAPDAAAVATTLQSISGLVAVELATLPSDSSSGGFVYRLNPALGIVGRVGGGFGPFFTESVLRGGRSQTGIGLRYKVATFASLQDADLDDGTFPANATRLVGSSQPLSVELLRLNIEARTMTITGNYGVTERLSIGGAVPVVNVRLRGQRVRAQSGQSILQSTQSGSSTGLGDIGTNVRYRLVDHGATGVSVGADLRLPTGREDDLLGAGKLAVRTLGVGSWEEGALAVHVNGGVGFGGVSREVFWSGAAAYAATPRVTLVGEIVGRHLNQLSRVADIYEPSLTNPAIESMRWVPVERGLYATFFIAGAKWNIARNWLINGNVLFRADDNGLRARVTPTVSLEFDFQR